MLLPPFSGKYVDYSICILSKLDYSPESGMPLREAVT
jgi:hypothetical protein